jgi:SAM-dependent methyltransferase
LSRAKYSAISHRNLTICNPLSDEKIGQAIELLPMKPTERAIDFGAGKGEFLIRLIERYGGTGTAVELENGYISEMEGLSRDRIPPGRITVILKDAKLLLADGLDHVYDAGICIGSTHAFGGYEQSLDALRKVVKPGGFVLIGDLYWKKPPPIEFLEFLGGSESDLGTHEGNVLRAEERGMALLWSCVASDDDFDCYESRTSKEIEDYATEHPEDPDCGVMLERVRNWRDATVKWGRDTWGFGLYLFRNGR